MPKVNTVAVGHANKPVPHETLTPISNIPPRGPTGKVEETLGRSFAGLEYTDDGPR